MFYLTYLVLHLKMGLSDSMLLKDCINLQQAIHAINCSVDVLVQVDATKHTLAKYLMELTITEYDMVHLLPSQIAAAALYLSIKLLDNSPWVNQICCHWPWPSLNNQHRATGLEFSYFRV